MCSSLNLPNSIKVEKMNPWNSLKTEIVGILVNFVVEHTVHNSIFGQIQLFFREMKKPNFPNTLIISAALNKPQNIIRNF